MAYAFNDNKTKAEIKKKTVTFTTTSHYSSGESYGYNFSLEMSQADTFLGMGAIDASFGNPDVSIRATSFNVFHYNGELYLWVTAAWMGGQAATALVTITAEVIYV